MKRKRYTEEQIIQALKEAEAGVRDATIYSWKAKYAGLTV